MFRDDRQVCAAVRVLLHSVRLGHLWTESGPTDEALAVLEHRGGALSHGEALMVFAAFDFWNGQGKTELADLLGVLDGPRMRLVAGLMSAVAEGEGAVDRWLAENGPPPPARAKPKLVM